VGSERCRGIGEIADDSGRQLERDRDRQRTGQLLARHEAEGHSAAARQNHARRPLGDLAETTQVLFGYELGGSRESADLVVAD
jgi:hypothetical protein